MKHTKGPWKVQQEKIKGHIRPLLEVWNQNTFVASLDHKLFMNAEENGEAQANAHLIAAAPEMLEMLERIVHEKMDSKLASELHLTIRKAKGGA